MAKMMDRAAIGYEAPRLEVIEVACDDVVRTSAGDNLGSSDPLFNGPSSGGDDTGWVGGANGYV